MEQRLIAVGNDSLSVTGYTHIVDGLTVLAVFHHASKHHLLGTVEVAIFHDRTEGAECLKAFITLVNIQGLLHGQGVETALAKQRCHVGAAVHREVGVLVGMSGRRRVIPASVVPVATSCGLIHHAGDVRGEDVAVSLASMRCFLYLHAVFAPSTKEHQGAVGVASSIAVD